MRLISETAGQELLWIQPAARKREHELRAGDDVVATLRFQRGSLADAEAEANHWTFKRQGFWHPRVTVRAAGSDADIAVFHPRWVGGGTLEFADGRALRLSSANFWQSEWVWQEKEQPLIRFKGRHGLIKAKGAVEIQPEAVRIPDLPRSSFSVGTSSFYMRKMRPPRPAPQASPPSAADGGDGGS